MRKISALNFLAFTHVLPVVTSSKLWRESDVWKFRLAFVLTNLWFYLGKEFCDFRIGFGRFLQWKLKLNFPEFEIGQPTQTKTTSSSDQSLKGKVFVVSPLESEGLEVQRGLRIWVV